MSTPNELGASMTNTDVTIDTGTDELLCTIRDPRRHHHTEPAGSAQRDVG
jgi:hypothetical protein